MTVTLVFSIKTWLEKILTSTYHQAPPCWRPIELFQGYTLIEKHGTSREITRPRIFWFPNPLFQSHMGGLSRPRIVNGPLIIDPEDNGRPPGWLHLVIDHSNQNLALLRATESFWKIERNYIIKNHNSFLHKKWFSGLCFSWIENSITGVCNRKKNYNTPNHTIFGVENLWILWTCLMNIILSPVFDDMRTTHYVLHAKKEELMP